MSVFGEKMSLLSEIRTQEKNNPQKNANRGDLRESPLAVIAQTVIAQIDSLGGKPPASFQKWNFARENLLLKSQIGTPEEFQSAADRCIQIARDWHAQQANHPGSPHASAPSSSPATGSQFPPARLCPACGSPAAWLSVYWRQENPIAVRCRECEQPPSPSLVGAKLYAFLGGPGGSLSWEDEAKTAERLAGPQSVSRGEQRSTHTLADLREYRCADGAVMFARPGWDDPRSPWWDDWVRLTIKEGADEAWRILGERTRAFSPKNERGRE